MARAPDIIQRPSIPLSATSDQPVDDVARPPVNASNDAEDQSSGVASEITPEELAQAAAARKGDAATSDMIEKPKADAADPAEPDADDDGIEVDTKNLPHYAVKEISKVRTATRARVAAIQAEATKAASDAAAAKAEAEQARRELEELRAKAPKIEDQPKVEEKPDPRPTRDLFDDPDAYDDAITQWADREADRKASAKVAEKEAADNEARAAADAAKKAEDEAATRAAQEEVAQQAHADWVSKTEAAKVKYTDYEEIALKDPKDGGPSISPAMAMAIQKAENGTDVAYRLGLDVEESKRIASINDPIAQVIEIGRMAERLANPQRRVARSRPIDPVNSSVSQSDNVSPDDEDMNAYYARRTKETAPNRQPFFPAGVH